MVIAIVGRYRSSQSFSKKRKKEFLFCYSKLLGRYVLFITYSLYQTMFWPLRSEFSLVAPWTSPGPYLQSETLQQGILAESWRQAGSGDLSPLRTLRALQRCGPVCFMMSLTPVPTCRYYRHRSPKSLLRRPRPADPGDTTVAPGRPDAAATECRCTWLPVQVDCAAPRPDIRATALPSASTAAQCSRMPV